jgi:hypothetical protein
MMIFFFSKKLYVAAHLSSRLFWSVAGRYAGSWHKYPRDMEQLIRPNYCYVNVLASISMLATAITTPITIAVPGNASRLRATHKEGLLVAGATFAAVPAPHRLLMATSVFGYNTPRVLS